MYHKMYRINTNLIENLIKNLDNEKIYMINPLLQLIVK
jgi:hypothetical protein